VDNRDNEKHVIEHRLNHKPLIGAAFQYPREGYKLFSLLTLEIHEMIVDLPTSFNLLFNFSKQASSLL